MSDNYLNITNAPGLGPRKSLLIAPSKPPVEFNKTTELSDLSAGPKPKSTVRFLGNDPLAMFLRTDATNVSGVGPSANDVVVENLAKVEPTEVLTGNLDNSDRNEGFASSLDTSSSQTSVLDTPQSSLTPVATPASPPSLFSTAALSRRANPQKTALFGSLSPLEADFADSPPSSPSTPSHARPHGDRTPPDVDLSLLAEDLPEPSPHLLEPTLSATSSQSDFSPSSPCTPTPRSDDDLASTGWPRAAPSVASPLRKADAPLVPTYALQRCCDVWRGLAWRAALHMDRWCALPVRVPDDEAAPSAADAAAANTGQLGPALHAPVTAAAHAPAHRAPFLLSAALAAKAPHARAHLPFLIPRPVPTHPGLMQCPFLPPSALPHDYAPTASGAAVADLPAVRQRYGKLLAGCVQACRVSYAWLLYRHAHSGEQALPGSPIVTSPAPAPAPAVADDPLLGGSHEWSQEFSSRALRSLIAKDLNRTQAAKALFKVPRVRAVMSRVLFIWAREHPELGYKQGMNELLAMVVLALHHDLNNDTSGDIPSDVLSIVGAFVETAPLPVAVCGQIVLVDTFEADCYALFARIMAAAAPYYAPLDYPLTGRHAAEFRSWEKLSRQDKRRMLTSPLDYKRVLFGGDIDADDGAPETDDEVAFYASPQTALGQKLHFIHHVLLRHVDRELYDHLTDNDVLPQLYLLRWLRLLYSREFSVTDALRVWDFLFEFSQVAALEYHRRVKVLLAAGAVSSAADSADSLPQPCSVGALYERNEAFTSPTALEEADYLLEHGRLCAETQRARQAAAGRGACQVEYKDAEEFEESSAGGSYARGVALEDMREEVGLAIALDYFALAMLLSIRDVLLQGDYSSLLSTLLDFPNVDLTIICSSCTNMFRAAIMEAQATKPHESVPVASRNVFRAFLSAFKLGTNSLHGCSAKDTAAASGNHAREKTKKSMGFFTSPLVAAPGPAATPATAAALPVAASMSPNSPTAHDEQGDVPYAHLLSGPQVLRVDDVYFGPAEAADVARATAGPVTEVSADTRRKSSSALLEHPLSPAMHAVTLAVPAADAVQAPVTANIDSTHSTHNNAAQTQLLPPRIASYVLSVSPAYIRAHFTKPDHSERERKHFQPTLTPFTYMPAADPDVLSPSSKSKLTFTSVSAAGYMVKLGGGTSLFRFQNFKRRYFALHGFVLRYYRDREACEECPAQTMKAGYIDLRGRTIIAGDADRLCIIIGPRTTAYTDLFRQAASEELVPDAHVDSLIANIDDHTRFDAQMLFSQPAQHPLQVDRALLAHIHCDSDGDVDPRRTYHLFTFDKVAWTQWLGLLTRAADIHDRGVIRNRNK